MGIDCLDFSHRVEKEFGVRLKMDETFPVERDVKGRVVGADITAGAVVKWVEATLIKHGKAVPEDCWPRVRVCIAETVQISPEDVSLESRLIRDIGFA